MKKSALIVLWITLIGVTWYLWSTFDISLTDVPMVLKNWLDDFGLLRAGLLYIVIYTLRPIIFFPATLLTLASGLLFGPWLGILFTIIGENFSANLAFAISRYMGRDFVKNKESAVVQKWDKKLQENGIVTVMIMRFLYLPFDGVNYGCGLTSMKQRDYAIGTFIGILPGLITFVLLGGAVSAHAVGMITVLGLDVPTRGFIFALSALFFVLGLVVARLLKKAQVQ